MIATLSVSWGSVRTFWTGVAIAIPRSFEKVSKDSARAYRDRYAVIGLGLRESLQ